MEKCAYLNCKTNVSYGPNFANFGFARVCANQVFIKLEGVLCYWKQWLKKCWKFFGNNNGNNDYVNGDGQHRQQKQYLNVNSNKNSSYTGNNKSAESPYRF